MQDITAASPDAVYESKAESEVFVASDAINGILSLIEKSVKHKETRLLMGRLLRQTAVLRKNLDKKVLRTLVNSCVPVASPAHGYLLGAIQEVWFPYTRLFTVCSTQPEHKALGRRMRWMKAMTPWQL